MGWKERFRQGSFRGIPFLIDAADSDFGRRIIAHEFPQREDPFVEDLGRKARRFTVECYLLGDNYLSQRDRLLVALEMPGAGPLIHPYFGRMSVHAENVKVRESRTETRIVRFQIIFVESGETAFPVTFADTAGNVQSKALAAKASIKDNFVRVYNFAALPYAQTQSVLRSIQTASNEIREAQGALNKVSDFARNLQDIGGALNQIVLDAERLAESFLNIIGFGFLDDDQNADAIPDLRQSFQGLIDLFSFDPAIPSPSQASAGFSQLIQLGSVTAAAAVSSAIEYDSQNEAIQFRNQILEKMETVFLADLDDSVFVSLMDLRTAVEQDISSRANTLARLIQFESPIPLPSLVIAYRLYGNIDQEQSIIKRNRVEHPGFVSGTGKPIQVLADA